MYENFVMAIFLAVGLAEMFVNRDIAKVPVYRDVLALSGCRRTPGTSVKVCWRTTIAQE